MRILRISLSNIASLAGEQTVDFTKAPLASAGLFSITGPTGSGKSTLLDALCLGLYAATPRLAVVQGTKVVEDQGLAVQQSDVRNLLRRGCGEGYAEVAFVGVDGCSYTARWAVRRAHAKADGRLAQAKHTLFHGNTEPGAEGQVASGRTSTEVREEIVAKVGLTFDQFRRAVLLAQGDFATFLKAKDAERAEILQALTGTEIFEKISIAVFERHKSEDLLVGELENKLGASRPLTQEERVAAEQELVDAHKVKEEIQARLDDRTRQGEWFRVEAVRKGALEEAKARVQECGRQVELEKPRARELQWILNASIEGRPRRTAEREAQLALELAVGRGVELKNREGVLLEGAVLAKGRLEVSTRALQRAEDRRRVLAEDLARARTLDVELVPLEVAARLAEQEYIAASTAFVKADGDLSTLHAELERLSSGRRALELRISKVVLFEQFAREVDVWLERFKAESKTRARRDGLRARRKKAAEEVVNAARRLEGASAALPSLREAVRAADATLRGHLENVESFDVNTMLSQRRNAIASQSALQEVETNLERQKSLFDERRVGEERLKTLETKKAAESIRERELRESTITGARKTMEGAQESLRLAEAAVSDHAVALRGTLVPGQACPVCGSCEHPNADGGHSLEKKVLAALRRDVTLKEAALQKAMADLSGVGALLGEWKGQEEKLRLELERASERLRGLEAYEPVEGMAAGVWKKRGAQREQELARCKAAVLEALNALDANDQERISAENKVKAARSDAEKSRDVLIKAETAEVEARNFSTNALASLEGIGGELEVAEREHGAAFGGVAPLLEALSASRGSALGVVRGDARQDADLFEEYDYEENPVDFVEWYERGAREWNATREALDKAAGVEASRLEQLEPQKALRNSANQAAETRLQARNLAQSCCFEKRAARAVLLGGRSVDEVEREMAAEVEAAAAAAEAAAKAHAEAEQSLGTHRGLLAEQQRQFGAIEEKMHAAKTAMDAWLLAFSESEGRETSGDDLDVWLGRDSEWIKREQRHLEDSAQKLATALGRESVVLREFEEHLGARATTDDADTVRGEMVRLAAEVKTAGEVVDLKKVVVFNDDERNRHSSELRASLERQRKQLAPWQKLNALIGSKEGTKFRDMAQQWTLEILLKHANAQLKMLSGRYRLERLRESLNLLVTDFAMDGQQRSVHSLSGGESFLVSLGLALGLASLTSSRLLIESLFIDEGFGSLDSETLRVALNALSHLESQGRKVGVISHVGEMVDAIPVQVRVVRVSGGASKVLV
jgi:exonuclease SbcC